MTEKESSSRLENLNTATENNSDTYIQGEKIRLFDVLLVFCLYQAFPGDLSTPRTAGGQWAVVLRGAEVPDFEGWKVLEEGVSKNRGKGSRGSAYHAAPKPALAGMKLGNQTHTAVLPALHTAGMAGRTRRE